MTGPTHNRARAPRQRTLLAVPDATELRLSRDDRQLIACARSLADDLSLNLALLVPERVSHDVALGQAEHVLTWTGPPPGSFAPQASLSAILAAIRSTGAAHVALLDTPRGGDLGRRAAIALDVAIAPAVVAFENAKVVSVCRAGAAERVLSPPLVLLLDRDFAHMRPSHAARSRLEPLEVEATVAQILDHGVSRVGPTGRCVEDAPFIVAGGNGVADWRAIERLAAALGAAVGASRPVCDRGIASRDRQIGSSGKVVQARCYVAFGVSGAVQHLDGIQACETVAAINLDPAAPIHVRADLSIVADAGAVVAALLARIEGAAHG